MATKIRESIFQVVRTRTYRTPKKGIPDYTERVLNTLFPPMDSSIFPKDRIDLRTVAIFGQPDSGKSTLAEYLAFEAKKRYGDQVNIVGIREARFRHLAAKMNEKPVQLLIVDDAKAMSRAGMKNIEDMNELDDVRHRYARILMEKGLEPAGYIISVHIKQRYMDLDVKFRSAHYAFFKTAASGDKDRWDMLRLIGPEAYGILEGITYRMNELRDQTAKSKSIVLISWLKEPGLFRAEYPKERVIEWHRLEEGETLCRSLSVDPNAISEIDDSFSIDIDPVLDMIAREGGDWSVKVDVFRAYQDAGSQSEIAERYGISQGTVSNYVREVRGMISKVVGEAYEKWAAKKWEQQEDVERVERFGGHGEPDLLVYHKDGTVTVVSCKCYYDAKTVSIPTKEFAPEISKAKELQAKGVLKRLLIDFNNIAKRTRVFRAIDPEMHDSTITFR